MRAGEKKRAGGRTSRPAKPAKRRRLRVELGERAYPIEIGVGTLVDAGPVIAKLTGAKRAAIITVPPVRSRYAGRLQRSLRAAGMRSDVIEVPDGDATKNLGQLGKLYDQFLDLGLDRSSAVIGLGGGMVGDLAGFAAATYLRGVPFVQVPTTLLAMVDASVGGKVAVNLKRGKNLAGAFYQPRCVWIDAATLQSLSPRQRAAGMAEIIKTGAIWDRALFEELEANVEAALELDYGVLLPIIEKACAIKAEVVRRDERESASGVRAWLNFGHTMAHAVEALRQYRGILHGEAVSIGMVFAAQRSEDLGLAPKGTRDRLEALLVRAGLPVELPDFDRKAYLSALGVDKKKRDARIRYIVLRRIGRAGTRDLTPAEILPARRARASR